MESFNQFSLIFGAWIVVLIIPGPDMALIMRTALAVGAKEALRTSSGMCLALIPHLVLASTGLGYLVNQYPEVFDLIQKLGGLYMCYLGFGFLMNYRRYLKSLTSDFSVEGAPGTDIGFKTGFISTLLNPKVTVFFVSLFSTIVSAKASLSLLLISGIAITASTYVFYHALVKLVRTEAFILFAGKNFPRVELVSGALFMCLGVNLIVFT